MGFRADFNKNSSSGLDLSYSCPATNVHLVLTHLRPVFGVLTKNGALQSGHGVSRISPVKATVQFG